MAKGDPRVQAAILVVLSAAWSAVVVWGASLLDLAAFTATNVATLTLIVMAVSYLLVWRN